MNIWFRVGLLVLISSSSSSSAFAKDAGASKSVNLNGQKVFEKVLPLVFKVKTSPSAHSPQASYGTGFVVDKAGLLITNYHVVSDSIVEPEKNKIFVMVAEMPMPAKVLAVNVVQDLALLRIDKTFEKVLPFAADKPSQGEPIYPIGQPEDLNMAIVEGTYNDELSYGEYKIIHLSAPINSGMSGGPTVNGNGELIGVNVSKQVSASSLSFSVPGRFAKELYEKNKNLKESPENFWPGMETQLVALQEALTNEMLKSFAAESQFSGWKVPEAPKSLKCWSVNKDPELEKRSLYDARGSSCDLQHAAYLSSEARTGTYEIELEVYENKKLNAWQFYNLLPSGGSAFGGRNWWRSRDGKKLQTKGECFSDIINSSTGIPLKFAYCARAYTYFPQLQDAHVIFTSLKDSTSAIQIEIKLNGFSKANIKKVISKYAEKIARDVK